MAFIDPKLVPKRKLSNGQEIPCMGMGTFGSDRFTPEQVSNAVAGAIRSGYRLFDCASVYGNEDLIGKVFEDAMKEGVVKREELFITSKVWNDMHGQGDVLLSCAKTLKDLRLDYLGLRRRQPESGQQALLRGRVHEHLAPDGTPGGYGADEEYRHEQHDDSEAGGGSAAVPDQAHGD